MEGIFFDVEFCVRLIPPLLGALPLTLLIAVVGMAVGSLVALGLYALRRFRTPVLAPLATVYISFFRGTPFLVQLFLIYYGTPIVLGLWSQATGIALESRSLPPLVCAFLAFSFNASAFLAETVRSSIEAVDRGQTEAGLAAGLSGWQTFYRIVGPQAFVVAVPNLGNFFLALVKGTSLAFTVAVVDVMAVAKIEASDGYRFLEAYLVVSLLYWGLCALFEVLFFRLEKLLSRHRKEVRHGHR